MKTVLNSPVVYHAYQCAVGGFSARIRAIQEYLPLRAGQTVIDIGCGPGHIVPHLPQGAVYQGFDLDPNYIEFANRRFGTTATFHCRVFDMEAAHEFGPADTVMMNGVLHHMDDAAVRTTASVILKTLKPGGCFFALDGVYVPGQNRIAKWFLDNDRGAFVRTEQGYRELLSPIFGACDFHVRHDLLRIPYTILISKCRKAVS